MIRGAFPNQLTIHVKQQNNNSNMRRNVVLFVLIFSFYSCSKDWIMPQPDSYNTDLTSCRLIINNQEFNSFSITDSLIRVQVPNQIDLSKSMINIEHGGKKITYTNNGHVQENTKAYIDLSDFTLPTMVTIYGDTDSTIYTLIIYDLPVLEINTPESKPIESKDVRLEGCTVRVLLDNQWEDYGTAGIKGRGNSTWSLPKKPYNIKLDKKNSVLGMAESKHWTLLANAFYDKTQLHNCVAFEVARKTDFEWVQSGEYVELILNGEDKGLYYLCEKPRAEKNRINIKELKPTDIDENVIGGGYLLESACGLEMNGRENSFYTDYFNKTGSNFSFDLGWSLESPDENVPEVQLNYIKNALNHMESLIYDDDKLMTCEYMNFFDIESFIDWKLVEDVCLNEEASRSKNISIYKNRGDDKFYMTPPWDLDAWTFGCREKDVIHTDLYTIYYYKLLKEPHFVMRLKEKWQAYKDVWASDVPVFIDDTYQRIRRSALKNEQMWPEWHEIYGNKIFDECVMEMKNVFLRQIDYMDKVIENY